MTPYTSRPTRALSLFNRESLMEIDLLYAAGAGANEVAERARKLLIARHGSEDFTITTQEQMLDVLGSILNILTLAVGAVGGISLLVGGVGILTIMIIAVNERTSEVGTVKGPGSRKAADPGTCSSEKPWFWPVSAGWLAWLSASAAPGCSISPFRPCPTHTPWSYVVLAELLAAVIGLAAGVLPAIRAANLDPIDALRAE